MKKVEKIMKSNWDFVLYKTDEGHVLNVTFCNSFVDVTRSFKVTDEEANLDFNGVKAIAEKIRADYSLYLSQEVTPVVTMP